MTENGKPNSKDVFVESDEPKNTAKASVKDPFPSININSTSSELSGIIKLPGIELSFPTTISGAIFGSVLVLTIGWVFTGLSDDVKKHAFNMWGGQKEQTTPPTKTKNEGVNPLIKYENEKENRIIAERALERTQNVIKELEVQIAELEQGIEDLAEKNTIEEINEIQNKASKISENAKEARKHISETKKSEKTIQETTEELIIEYSKERKYSVLVNYFLDKKHFWTGNYFWVPFTRVANEINSKYANLYSSDNDLEQHIQTLVDLKVLASTVMENGIQGYGVNQNSYTLKEFGMKIGHKKFN